VGIKLPGEVLESWAPHRNGQRGIKIGRLMQPGACAFVHINLR